MAKQNTDTKAFTSEQAQTLTDILNEYQQITRFQPIAHQDVNGKPQFYVRISVGHNNEQQQHLINIGEKTYTKLQQLKELEYELINKK